MHAGSALERAIVAGDVAISCALFMTAIATYAAASGDGLSIWAACSFGFVTLLLIIIRRPGRLTPTLFALAGLLVVMAGALYCAIAWSALSPALKTAVPIMLGSMALYTIASLFIVIGGKDHMAVAAAVDLITAVDLGARSENVFVRILRQPFWSPVLAAFIYALVLAERLQLPRLEPVISDAVEILLVFCSFELVARLIRRDLRATLPVNSDPHWMMLVLRPFPVDGHRIRFARRNLIERLIFPLRDRATVGSVLSALRHFGAKLEYISDPDDDPRTDHLGDQRYAQTERWQAQVDNLARRAQGIILFSGATPGAAWEVRQSANVWQRPVLLVRNECAPRAEAARVFAANTRQFGYDIDAQRRSKLGALIMLPNVKHCLPLETGMTNIPDLALTLASIVSIVAPEGDVHLPSETEEEASHQVLASAASLSSLIQDFQARDGIKVELTPAGLGFIRAYSLHAISKEMGMSPADLDDLIERSGSQAWISDVNTQAHLAELQECPMDVLTFCLHLYSTPSFIKNPREDMYASCGMDLQNVIEDWNRLRKRRV